LSFLSAVPLVSLNKFALNLVSVLEAVNILGLKIILVSDLSSAN
jgi:hypothetical protein